MQAGTQTRNTLLVSALALLLVTGSVALVQAQGPGGRGGRGDHCAMANRGPELRLEKMAEQLDLTADQVQAIEKIRAEGRARNQELRKQVMRLQNEKRGELLKDEPNTDTVIKLTRSIGELRTTMQTNRMENRLAIRKLLTPEQKDKMLIIGARQGRHGQRGFGGQRGGDCDNSGPHGRGGRGNR